MGSTRRTFTEEYKAQAVSFVIDGGRSITEVARNIGCHETTLGVWVRKTKNEDPDPVDPTIPPSESERMELIRLRGEIKAKDAELAEMRMQVEFAKKVATWFAREKQ